MAVAFAASRNELVLASRPSYEGYSILGWGKVTTARSAKAVIHSYIAYSTFGYTDISIDGSNNLVGQDALNPTAAVLTGMSAGTVFFWGLTVGASSGGTLAAYGAKLGDSVLSKQTVTRGAADGTAGRFTLGDSEYSEWYYGSVDNVLVFDRVLSDAEMQAQFRRRAPIASPFAWFPMLYPSLSDNYADRSGNGRNLTLNGGTPTVVDGAPVGWGAPIIVPQYATAVGPVLSLPGVTDITATSVRPKVTLTF